MTINLSKGQAISLSKITSSKKFELRASWDLNELLVADVDIMCVLCDSNNKVLQPQEKNLIFYNNLESLDKSVIHTGDNKTGDGDGWDEIIKLDFSKMNPIVSTVPMILNIHEGLSKGINFGLVKNLKVQIYDVENQQPVAEFTPELTNSLDTCIIIGNFIKNNGEFFFKASGIGAMEGLDKVLAQFAIVAEY